MTEHAAMALPALERFDGAEAWAKLDPEVQARIGAIALEVVLAWHLIDLEGPGPESALPPVLTRVASSSDNLLMGELEATVFEALPDGAFATARIGIPRIPSLLGGVCRACGCSQNDACDDGCGWAADDLCTACTHGQEHAHG